MKVFFGSATILAAFLLSIALQVPAEELPPEQTVHVSLTRDRSIHHFRQTDLTGWQGIGLPPEFKEFPITLDNSKTDERTCNPVLVMTGEKYKEELDFSASGGLGLTRIYRSRIAKGTLFGANWMSSLDYPGLALAKAYTNWAGYQMYHEVTLTQPDGTSYLYKSAFIDQTTGDSAEYYSSSSSSTGRLTWNATSGYKITTDDKIYHYPDGNLRTIKDLRTGNVLTFSRVGAVLKITDSAGRWVELTKNQYGVVTQVRDPAGNVWTYVYDPNSPLRLAKVVSPGSSPDIREYHYEDPNPKLLTGISINGVRYSRYSYQSDGRVGRSALEGGAESDTFVYGGTNFTMVTDAHGQPTTYNYTDVLGERKLTSVTRETTPTCPLASVSKIAYDSYGYTDYELDWNGNKTDYTYDSFGTLQEVVTAAGTPQASKTTHTWTGTLRTGIKLIQSEYKDASDVPYLRVNYAYSTVLPALLASETWTDLTTGDQRKTEYGYTLHSNGTLASKTVSTPLPDGGMATTRFSYDTAGNLTSRTNALNQTEYWSEHNGLGQPGRYVDINGVATTFAYRANGTLESFTQLLPSGDRVTKLTYNNDRKVTDIVFADGSAKRWRYSAGGRLESVGNGAGQFVTSSLDIAANSLKTSSPREMPSMNSTSLVANSSGTFSSTTRLDSLARPYTTTGNNSQQLDYRYDSNGNLTSVTDALNRKTSYEYDPQNRLFKITAPDGGVTRMEYGADGLLRAVIDPRALRTTYDYNGFGDRIKLTSPDTGVTTYNFDAAGRLERENRQDGKVITYKWDALGRMLSRTSGAITESFTYDEGNYGGGKLTRMNDATGQTTYSYNAAGQLTGQINNVFGQVLTTTWSYDSSGRLIGMTYPTGLSLVYEYDAYGRITSIKTASQLHN
ncbi:MAG: DUF6531 domain-containing protein [Pseudomonadota bacterium]